MATTISAANARSAFLTFGLRREMSDFFIRRRVYKRTYNELSAMTNRELADIGINRGMIAAVAREAANRA